MSNQRKIESGAERVRGKVDPYMALPPPLPEGAPGNFVYIPLGELPTNDLLSGQDPEPGLIASVKDLGVLEPILVIQGWDGKFRLKAGARRIKAARAAGIEFIPALVEPDTEAATGGHEGKERREGRGTPRKAPPTQNYDKRARNVRKHIGERIMRRRAVLGQGQGELAGQFGVSQATWSKYERGDLDINAGDLPLLAEILGTTVFYFFMGLDYGGEHGASAESAFMQALNAMNRAAAELAWEEMPEVAAKIARGAAESDDGVGSQNGAEPGSMNAKSE